MSTIPERAKKLHSKGLTPWGVRHNGTKAPAAGWEWKDLTEQPTWTEIEGMFADDHTGMGILTGSTSGGIELLEFENRAINERTYEDFLGRLADAGLDEVWERIADGYTVSSGGNGLHFMFRVEGDCLPNTKLAMRPATSDELELKPNEKTKTLIETRGQGGFVIFGGSNGKIHPDGGSWEVVKHGALATISLEERDAIYGVAQSFDEVVKVARHVADHGLLGGGGSYDDLYQYVIDEIGVDVLLAEAGWTPMRARRDGQQYWVRPGKDPRDGHSGSLFPDGGFSMWTTTIDPVWEPLLMQGANGWLSLTPCGILAAVRYEGDLAEAMSACRAGITARDQPAPAPGQEPTVELTADVLNLPPEFWDAREVFGHVRQAAHSRMESPDAVLGALIARFATIIPTGYGIPPVVGSAATFDWLSVLAAATGGGKSSAMKISRELWEGPQYKSVVWDLPAPSGEGLITSFFELMEDEDGGGRKKMVLKKTKNAVLFSVDEAMALVQAGSHRQGSTIASVLCAGWAGQDPGQANASIDKRRIGMVPWSFRMSGLAGIQLSLGWNLLEPNWIEQGLSGRLVFFITDDETIPPPSELPEWPGSIDFPIPPSSRTDLRYDKAIVDEVQMFHWLKKVGKRTEDAIDGHKMLTRMKLAGIFALMEGRLEVSPEDWELAEMLQTTSIAIRDRMLAIHKASVGRENVEAAQSAGYYDGIRKEASNRPLIERARDAILRRAAKGPAKRRELKEATKNGDVRKQFSVALDELVSTGKIIKDDTIYRLPE